MGILYKLSTNGILKITGALVFIFCATVQKSEAQISNSCPAPPLGWNSWTNHGWKISEKAILENAFVMAVKLKASGYRYIVLDGGWHDNPEQGDSAVTDQYGKITSKERFPHGIAYLADTIHSLGLKFGIHIMRGVSRTGYKNNIPVFGTPYRVRDITDTSSLCSWSDDNYGIDMAKPGAQEYYDSFIAQLVSWGVDFIKIDDVTEHPAEILAVKAAIKKTGKRVVLSLSPGDNSMIKNIEAFNAADMVRITPDIWDNQAGINQAFYSWKRWSGVTGRNFWADMDMIPFGHLGLCNPNPDYLIAGNNTEGKEQGKERMSAFSLNQKYTFITLRAMSASPFFMGGDLPTSDSLSFAIITNKEMLACNQNGVMGKLISEKDSLEVWETGNKKNVNKGWIAVFNRSNTEKQIRLTPFYFNFKEPFSLYNIWQKKWLGILTDNSPLKLTVKPGAVIFCRYNKIKQK